MSTNQQTLEIDLIQIDDGIQSRATISESVISEYADEMLAGAQFPAVAVFRDLDGLYWLADGFHRLAAYQQAWPANQTIEAEIHQGSRRDAIFFAVASNTSHGLRRSKEDKRRAVDLLIADPEWSQWSNVVLAKHAGVMHTFVAKRRHLNVNSSRIRRCKNGRIMNTTNTGRGNHSHRTLTAIITQLEIIDSKLDSCVNLRPAQVLLRQASRQIINAVTRSEEGGRA